MTFTTRPLFAASLALAAFLATQSASAETPAPSGFPVDIAIPKAPALVLAEGRQRLLYELRVTNFYSAPIELADLELLDSAGAPLAHYGAADLSAMIEPVGSERSAESSRQIAGGGTGVAFVDLILPAGNAIPTALRHRFTFTVALPDGRKLERILEGPGTVIGPAARTIAPPLAGSGWFAANGLAARDHRRSWNSVNGRAHLAQRFAIDWIRLDRHGRFIAGDPGRNASYADYDAQVFAVADATVVSVIDGQPENAGANPAEGRAPSLDTITGNAVILDLGGETYALYAHLRPGTITVKPGDRVHTGQVLGKLGNSGNSDAPHLHFQLMDRPSALGAEGLPYAIAGFTALGVAGDPAVVEGKAAWRSTTPPRKVTGEFPANNAVVSFP